MIDSSVSAIADELTGAVQGDVLSDPWSLGVYATDASLYQVRPVVVVLPRHDDDVKAAVAIAAARRVPILPRGGGTSLSGQTVGEAMILDFSKYMNSVLELNTAERWARVQPGLVLGELNQQLAAHGLQFAPDPATATRANIGGMIGNNTAGTRSIIYGRTIDHVLSTRVLLTDGTELTLEKLSPEAYDVRSTGLSREAQIYGGFRSIIRETHDEIVKRYPKVLRRVSGYALDAFTGTDPWNLSKIVTGSEGTLSILLEAKINLEPLPEFTSLYVPHFTDIMDAIRSVKPLLALGPAAVEVLDETVLAQARENRTTAPLCGFLDENPKAILIVQFYGDSADHAATQAEKAAALLRERGGPYAHPVITDAPAQKDVWDVRKHGLGLMLGMKGDRKPLPFIEDAAVPDDALSEYIERILAYCKNLDTRVAMYAHASVGLIHVRPILDLRLQEDIDRFKKISEESFRLVMGYGGSISGEHGDGMVRSVYNEPYFGAQIYQAFKDVKSLFDPTGLMNPGKIVDAQPIDQRLRFGTEYQTHDAPTHYHYREDGSFAHAVHLCTGVGACRQTLTGVMCPSYMATRDEAHSTRGRANALRLAMSGQMGDEGMTSKGLHEIFDLCLSCKACKSECPSNVDVARLKGEFLQRYMDRHGPGVLDRMVAATPAMARRLCGPLAPVVNRIQKTGLARGLLERIAGVDRRRTPPAYARQSLSLWFRRRDRNGAAPAGKVVLFADTFTNYFEPEIGRAAVELLEACGYYVTLFDAGCCQRTRISKGFLRDAKKHGTRTLEALDRFLQDGIPVVALEPSCASALTDDLPDLADDDALAERAQQGITLLEIFLEKQMSGGAIDVSVTSPHRRFLVHGHCHQKALFRTQAMKEILGRVPDAEVEEVDSSCCGMAGSFGYEKKHYDISKNCGERRLFPAVRECSDDTVCVACGFSCRHQIADFTGAAPLHWVQAVGVATK